MLAHKANESSFAQQSAGIEISATTCVEEIETEEIEGLDIYFDLSGRPVTEPQRGSIYIKNGKKIIF